MTKKPNYEQIIRLATKKEASLAKLPPCEATFHQHVLRASLQTYIWKSSQKVQPPVRSPLMFGWEDKGVLVPVFFRRQMSSDFLQDLLCSCKGKSICSSSCICFEQNLSCTDLCPCYGSDMCKNEQRMLPYWKMIGHDVWNLVDFSIFSCNKLNNEFQKKENQEC
jgi:hypothetical protein